MRGRKKINHNPILGKLLRCTDIYRYIAINKLRPIAGIRSITLDLERNMHVVYLDKGDQTIVNHFYGDCSTEEKITEAVKQINECLKEAGWR